jgi:hypothetical protein
MLHVSAAFYSHHQTFHIQNVNLLCFVYERPDDDCKKQPKHVACITIKRHYTVVVMVTYLLTTDPTHNGMPRIKQTNSGLPLVR